MSSDLLISSLGSFRVMCLISMKLFKVAILFFKVMFTIFIIGNFDLHADSSYRCSRPEVFCEKGVLRNFTKFIEEHLRQSLFFKYQF